MGWFIVSILLPLAAPLLALALFKTLPLPVPISLMAPFKDGQLCWGAMGCCASALYEINTPPQAIWFSATTTQWITGILVGILTISALIATGGAVFRTRLRRPLGVTWHRHFRCFLASAIVTLLAAGFCALVHYAITLSSD